MKHILIVDDDRFFRLVTERFLTKQGYDVVMASGGEEALEMLAKQSFDLMITDINMMPMNGMALLEISRRKFPAMGVIMLTGVDEIEVALDAMKKGAFDFLIKPLQIKELYATVQRSLKCYSVAPQDKPILSSVGMLDGLVTESASMSGLCDMLRRVAPANVAVLLCGEPGTEPELIARTLHYYSPRKDAPLLTADCAGMAPEQIAPALFGTADGASGWIDEACGGTLFIHRIEAMPLSTQAELLAALKSRSICPVNGSEPHRIDVRFVFAADADLEERVARKLFNENLFNRLCAIRIEIPPLRSRAEDIPCLVRRTLHRVCASGDATPAISPDAAGILYHYTWPGNLDELEDAVRFATERVGGGVITRETLPPGLVEAFESGSRLAAEPDCCNQLRGHVFKEMVLKKHAKLLGETPEHKERS